MQKQQEKQNVITERSEFQAGRSASNLSVKMIPPLDSNDESINSRDKYRTSKLKKPTPYLRDIMTSGSCNATLWTEGN